MSVTLLRTAGRYLLVYGVALIILLPFIWVLLSAFKPESELLRYPPTLWPERWTLENFTQFFQATSFHVAMFNSGMIAAATTVLAMAVAAPAAYALARFHNPLFEGVARLFELLRSARAARPAMIARPAAQAIAGSCSG